MHLLKYQIGNDLGYYKFTQFGIFSLQFGRFNVRGIFVRAVQCSWYKLRNVILIYMNEFIMFNLANMILYTNKLV